MTRTMHTAGGGGACCRGGGVDGRGGGTGERTIALNVACKNCSARRHGLKQRPGHSFGDRAIDHLGTRECVRVRFHIIRNARI